MGCRQRTQSQTTVTGLSAYRLCKLAQQLVITSTGRVERHAILEKGTFECIWSSAKTPSGMGAVTKLPPLWEQ